MSNSVAMAQRNIGKDEEGLSRIEESRDSYTYCMSL